MTHKKLKVLCLGRFYDEEPGGTQTHVESLFESLSDRVEFINLVPARRFQSDTTWCGPVPTFRAAGIKLDSSVYLSLAMVWRAWRLHRKHQFDVVHLHFPDPMSHLASMVLPSKVARVITWHSDILRQKSLLRFYRPWLMSAINRAKAILVATPSHVSSSEMLAPLASQLPIHVVPFGFDFSNLVSPKRAKPEEAEDCSDSDFVIFALGRHVYYKGFEYLIRAVAQMDSRVRLILGGDGPLTPSLKALAKDLKVSEQVRFAGRIPDSDLPAYYQACDVFCLPAVARTEAFGIVQVEAMACAKPVVSTRLGNGVDYVNRHGETGLLATPGDVSSLVGCLQKLQRDPQLRETLGQAGLHKAQTEYSLENMGRLTLNVYKLAAGRGLEEATRENSEYRPN